MKKSFLLKLLYDIKNKTSYSVDFLLSENINDCISLKGIHLRKFFAPLLRLIYKTQTKYKIKIECREPLKYSKKGRIFAINHRQADDIVIGANIVNKSAYIVFGNKYLALDTTNGIGLWAYGMILMDRSNKANRNSTYKKMKYIIENGGNIIIYPEGYWNLDDDGESCNHHPADSHNSENWLIQDFNIGMFKLAKETGCEIVPVILHYDEFINKICYGHRGKPFKINNYDNIFEKKDELITIMKTTYYQLMEKYSLYERKDLEFNGKTIYEQWNTLKTTLINDCNIENINYKLDLKNEKFIGKAKVINSVTTYKEAFSHLDKITPSKKTAFLFNNKQN